MPTQKKFLDQDGLIQLLQEIESLDETNIKDVYWSTDNADTYPTIAFKVGDDNGSPHSIKKFTFKGDTTSPAPTNATTRSITLTISGTDKTITYYDTTGSAGITYTNATDSNQPSAATNVKAALDRVITKLASIADTDEKVKQTAQTGSTGLPILTATSETPTSGAAAEAGYDTDFKFTPNSNTLTVKAATSSASGVTITPSSIKVGTTASNGAAELTPSQLKVGSGTLTSTAYSGKATQTETDLNTVATGKGSDMVAYSSNDSVKDAIDDIYSQIGSGGGGNSLTSRIETLENGGNLVEGTNITLTKDTTNHTVTISAVDEKVAYTSDTTTSGNLPVVLGNGTTPTTPGGVKYNNAVTFNPTEKTLYVQDENTQMSIAPSALNAVSGTGSLRKEIVVSSTGIIFLTTSGNQIGKILNNGTTVTFTGTSAKANSDGNGNNIVNTYATKAALDALSDKWTGQFVVLKSSGDTATQYLALKRIIAAEEGGQEPAAADIALFDFGYIYLLENTENGGDNVFDEFIKVTDTETGTSYYMEKIGTTDAGVDVVSIPATGSNSVASLFETYVLNA